ncbi:MAG: RNA methyltransferase [Candidatus Hodarchaeota archaeon]
MNHTANTDEREKPFNKNHLSVVIVEPSKPQNLGSIARLIMNFGFSNLILVNPQLSLADPEIQIVARRAEVIINRALFVSSLEEIRKQFDLIIGTTARVGSDYNLRRVAISPEELLVTDLHFNNLAVVFGREQHGLTNREISLCDLIVSIPTHQAYPVMNVSHAIAILLYFFSRKFHEGPHYSSETKTKHHAASYEERQQLIKYFDQLIKITKYHPEKQHVAIQSFSNIISRGYVTGRELTTIMGVLKWTILNLQKSP